MGFLRSPIWTTVAVVVAMVTLLTGAAVFQVDRATRPPRQHAAPLDFELLRMEVESVEFPARDGLRLSGWLLRGRPDLPAIVLAHDLGSSKSALANLASVLMQDGFTLLLLDLRAHGDSAGKRSSLGVDEKRDLLGAVEYLRELDGVNARQVGIYGVGIGAHAAVLAAAEDQALRVLVLDSLRPDVTHTLGSELYGEWELGKDYLAPFSAGVFRMLSRADTVDNRAADVLAKLRGRDVLLIGIESDAERMDELKGLYEAIPEQADADGNLVLLPATQGSGLYGADLALYHERVASFFRSRLIAPGQA